ncbi:mucin-associated surface protein (MASP) [Trypanosoma cruzi Dm28c]|uniref:Mucin-associated surface protein (MASP) n=1 Tax=Trypanosoma cruzi Dm28c TaxID=1416333 RepID=V5BJV5_TRYCR|nr:mucin-associated surface protein (MASP) [Trypanosoma cruzi Dm28c]
MNFFIPVLCVLLLLVLVNCDHAMALCPSNGNTHVIYVTSNMGDNIWAFDTSGQYIGLVINVSTIPFRVAKLREMTFGPGNHLYIASARGKYSRIFAVSGNGLLNHTLGEKCTRNYLFTATAQSSANPFLDHPYSMAFHPQDDSLFVANQNSVTVTRYERVQDDKDASPRWEPVKNVAHAVSNASGLADIPDKAGLFASAWSNEYSMRSVRGLTISPPLPRALVEQAAPQGWYSTERGLAYYIVVCDIAADQVHVFLAKTGEHVFSIPVSSPVQVLFPSRYQKPISTPTSYFETPYMYVTSKEDALTFLVPLLTPSHSGDATSITNPQRRLKTHAMTKRVPNHSFSGIFENPSHEMLLIADRLERRISIFASPFLANNSGETELSPFLGHFASKLPDQPEFILTTAVEEQSAIPLCYELGEDGSFRYVALCTAGYIWALGIFLISLVAILFAFFWKIRRCYANCIKQREKSVRLSNDGAPEDLPLLDVNRMEGYGAVN